MPMLTDLDKALRAFGIDFTATDNWQSDGHGGMHDIRAILVHHTAGGGTNDWKTVKYGRPGLKGPLAQLTLERDGRPRIIAAGVCYHAGNGAHPLIGRNNGNIHCIGIEGVSPGVGSNAWTEAQRREYPRLVAALCRWYKLDPSRVIFHKEWATPRGRKIDAGEWDPNAFRREVARLLQGNVVITPEDEMSLVNFPISGKGMFPLICPVGKVSGVTAAAWLSATIGEGKGTIRAYAQSDTAGIHDWTWYLSSKDGLCKREWIALWDGVTQVIIHYDLTGRGTIGLETRAK